MVKNRLKTLLIKLRKRYGDVQTESEMLHRFVSESEYNNESSYLSSSIKQSL
jgi:hypothetical protein